MSPALAFLNMPDGLEWLMFGVIFLLLYGRETPVMMRKLGAAVREFRQGLLGLSRLGEEIQAPPPVGERQSRPSPLVAPLAVEPEPPRGAGESQVVEATVPPVEAPVQPYTARLAPPPSVAPAAPDDDRPTTGPRPEGRR
jgi:hypothetical protein